MFNSTNVAGASNASASTYGSSYGRTASNHHIGPEQAGDLGLGLGRLARGGIDYLANWWQSYWNTPSQEQLSMDRQVKIFYFRIEECVSEFHSALNKLDKDPKNSKVHEKIESIASILEKVSLPNDSKDLQDFQNSKFDGLKKKISKMELPTEVVNKLKSTSPAWFQNMKSAENDSKKGQEKKLESHRVKKHKRSGKQQSTQKQKNKAEGSFKPSANTAKEKIDEKVSSKPGRVAENKKTNEQAKHANRQAANCHTYDLTQTHPTNFFKLVFPPNFVEGLWVAGIRDVNGDGIADFAMGNWGASSFVGQVWIIYGGPNVNSVDLSNFLPSQGLVITGPEADENFGQAIQGLGDFNNDGKNDIVIGANNGAYVLFGPLINAIDLTTCNGLKCFMITGCPGSDFAGGDDVSGDNIPDLLMGVQSSIFGIFGGPGPWPAEFNLNNLNGTNGFVGSPPCSNVFPGCALTITMGKMQQNAIASFAVSTITESPSSPPGLTNAGIVYVFNGRNKTWPAQLNFTLDGSNKGFTAYGESHEFTGNALSIGGDFFQNGKTNIITTTETGKVYIFEEPSPSNSPLNLGILNGTNGGIGLQGPLPTTNTYLPSIALTDINNDGNLDIAVGMPDYPISASEEGGILFILGQAGGFPSNFTLSSNTSFIVPGISGSVLLGRVLANLGDINGDGREDLGVVAQNYAVYILLGQPSTCPPPASTNSPTNSTTNSTTSSPNSSPSNTGEIVGGVIAGAVIVGTAMTVMIIWAKKKGYLARKEEDIPTRMQQNQFFGNL